MKKLALLALLMVGGCVDHEPGVTGVQSFHVELIGPADPGSPDMPLDDNARTVTIKVSALDETNEIDTTFEGDLDVYVQFLGTLTPELGASPLAHVTLTAGVSNATMIDLPPVFGPTILWIEDGTRDGATYATGTSPTLWYRDPFMQDISKPLDETALDALSSSPLENKQVGVNASRYGANGKLIVTGVFAQGYTLSDSDCSTTPCTTGDYDHVTIFSFSKPKDQDGDVIEEGEAIDGFAGAVEEFNGLTEIGFPQSFVSDKTADPARIPQPAVIQAAWLTDPIQLEKVESALVEIDNGYLCPLDDDFTTYKQWKLSLSGDDTGCGSPINIITSGVVEFDPSTQVGNIIPTVIGTLRPVNIGSFNVWIVYPRSSDDLTLP
jgi:hypothetical protein